MSPDSGDESQPVTVRTSEVTNPQTTCPCRRCGSGALVALVVIAAVAGIVLYARTCGSPAKKLLREPHPRFTQTQPTADLDKSFRHRVTGTWEDDYQGKRTMTLKEDGSGTMVVELSGWHSALSAPRLRFDMVWSVEGGHLKKRTVGGTPATQVQIILKTMGDRVDEPILELTEHRLLLLDQDGKTKYDWRRVRK